MPKSSFVTINDQYRHGNHELFARKCVVCTKTSHIVLNKDAATSITGTYHISTTRHWSVGYNKDERWLADQVTHINTFSVDNPELEKELSLKQYLDGKPNSTTMIKTLTHDTLVFELNDGVTLLNCKKQPSPQVL